MEVIVDARIDLNDLQVWELVKALDDKRKGRKGLDKSEMKEIKDFLLQIPGAYTRNNETVKEQTKYDFFMENFDKITLEQLENLVK